MCYAFGTQAEVVAPICKRLQMTPNLAIDRSAQRQRRSVPVPLRGPAPGHAKRWAHR